jgi:hypothetical protein
MTMTDVEWLVHRVDTVINMEITEAEKLAKLETIVIAVKYDLGMDLVSK